ncbi:MAG: NAD(P)-dependent oxidoreductase [Nitrospirae bacterium]|nr:NAD(P)-dependent oxidoreductase [Nitrospirota bacterium]
MKILVLGGSGFIGSHLADALSEGDHEVTIFDRRRTRHLSPAQVFVQGDLLCAEQLREVVRGHHVVYQMAGIPHLEIGRDHPVETVEQNVLGTVLALEASRLAGVKRFIYASSIYVYSEEGSFYRCSKQAAELYIEEYERRYGLEYVILRYGTVYGPRADEYNSVQRYLRQALQERRVVAYGTGGETREYIHVRDAALSSVHVLREEFRNQRVILTGPSPMRFRDLLRMIRDIVGKDVRIEMRRVGAERAEELLPGHYRITPYSFKPKVARKLVNNPCVDFGQGLLECLEEIYEETAPPIEASVIGSQAG